MGMGTDKARSRAVATLNKEKRGDPFEVHGHGRGLSRHFIVKQGSTWQLTQAPSPFPTGVCRRLGA